VATATIKEEAEAEAMDADVADHAITTATASTV
jgi:hypothetical protein